VPKLSRSAIAFTELVLEVFRVNRALLDAGDRVTAPAGLTSARWQVLGVIEDEAATVAGIARTMGLRRQSVQQTANGLVRDGFARWLDNPRDRRANLLELTSKGKRSMAVVVARHASFANAIGRAHDEPAVRRALVLLKALRRSLEVQDEHDRRR
jgi:DNA-binding MarR family transcriptional regulator